MTTLADLIPDASSVLALEPEEIAGLVLELFASAGPHEGSRLNPATIATRETIGNYARDQQDAIALVIMEGWNWLLQEGLIAPYPENNYGWHFITRRGSKIKNRENLAAYRNTAILPRKMLHPIIDQACWSSFLRGDYDTAVFQAFKELEVSIREAGKFNADDYGVKLARKAFQEHGPLTDQSMLVSEQEALSHLFAGALGSYKNPHSHRKVKLSVEETVEMIILASHLLKIVDSHANR